MFFTKFYCNDWKPILDGNVLVEPRLYENIDPRFLENIDPRFLVNIGPRLLRNNLGNETLETRLFIKGPEQGSKDKGKGIDRNYQA